MRSGTSYFNTTVFKKTFLRFWPLWAANFVVWLVVFPLMGLTRLRYGSDALRSMTACLLSGDISNVIAAGAVVLSLAVAMAACSHLYNPRSANFFGMFPVRREGLFLSVYAAGLAMLILPDLAIFALMLLLELAGDALFWTPLLYWLATVCIMELFFFSFGMFFGMFTGHILALPVFYGVFNAIALAVYGLISWTLSEFYYGFDVSSLDGMETVVEWLTPVWAMSRASCEPVYIYHEGTQQSILARWELEGQAQLIVYAIAGLAFAAGALLLYRRRHMETAGDIVAVKPMRPVFKYGVAVCTGFALGFVTALILGLEELGLAICIILWGAAGCFAAQMLLDKTFKVFHKWRGPAVLSLVFAVLFAAVSWDFTGYETRLPNLERVAYAEVTGLGGYPSDDGSYWQAVRVDDPEELSLVLALHSSAIEEREDRWDKGYCWDFRVCYHLDNGTTMSRRYVFYGDRDDLHVAGSTAWTVQKLLNSKTLTERAYEIDKAQELLSNGGRLIEVRLNPVYSWNGTVQTYSYDGVEDIPILEEKEDPGLYFYGADAQAAWSAMLADLESGNIGTHQAVRSDDDYNDLPSISFYFAGQVDSNKSAVTVSPPTTAPTSPGYSMSVCMALTPEAVNLWAVLGPLVQAAAQD